MWQSQRKTQLMIVKRPQTKDKRCCIGISNKTFYTHPPSGYPQSKIKFKYNDYMWLASQSLLTLIFVHSEINMEFRYSDLTLIKHTKYIKHCCTPLKG